MCGIAGFSFKKGRVTSGKLSILATKLAQLNDDRGGHSWGVVRVTTSGRVEIDKGLGELGEALYSVVDARTMMLHTRYATTGAKTLDNAHPFEIGPIVGAHNGMVYNHMELLKKYDRKFECDSPHLFAHIAEDRDFSDIEGYGAIQWLDRRDTTRISLSRLSGGELSIYAIGDINDPDGVVWSSDEMHVLEAMDCAGIKLATEYGIDTGKTYFVRNGALFVTEERLDLKPTQVKTLWQDYMMGANDSNTIDLASDDSPPFPMSKYERELSESIDAWDRYEAMDRRDRIAETSGLRLDDWNTKIHRQKMA